MAEIPPVIRSRLMYIIQAKVEDSGVYNFTAVKDGNNLKIATAGSTFSGKKWVTMIIFGTA